MRLEKLNMESVTSAQIKKEIAEQERGEKNE